MTRQNATNFTAPLQFPYATAGTDVFMKEDVQILAQAVDQHNHTTGKGLPIAAGAIPNGSITSAMIADGTIQGADIATGAITTTQIADGTIATADLANQAVTNAKLGTDTARLNLLTNGGFEINQRNGPATQIGGGPIYRLDRWYLQTTAGALLGVTQISSTIGTPGFSANLTYTHAAGGVGLQSQQIEAPAQFGGKTVSLSVMAKASVVGYARLQIAWNGGATYGGYNTTTTGERLTVTATLPSGLT